MLKRQLVLSYLIFLGGMTMAQEEQSSTYVQVGEAEVSYFRVGSGPYLVLVHGTGATKDTNWGPLVEALQDRYTIVAMDLSGSGETLEPGGEITLDVLVDQVIGAARAAGAETYHLLGYSLGAVVAATVAARNPESVQSLITVAGWPESGLRERHQFELWQRLFEQDPETIARFAMLTGMSPDFWQMTDEELEGAVQGFTSILPPGLDRQAAFDATVNIRTELASVEAPTLVVGMTHDQMVPLPSTRDFANAISSSSFVELNAGHLLPFEKPTLLIETVEAFLAEQAAD